MTKVLFPGSFDPITKGHLDIIQRASAVFDEVIIAVLVNSAKQTLFTMEERTHMICDEIKDMHNVQCVSATGLTIELAEKLHTQAILRGVRSIKDYEYEMEIAAVNRYINPSIETILFYTSPAYAHISSSTVKELAHYEQNVTEMVSANVIECLHNKLK